MNLRFLCFLLFKIQSQTSHENQPALQQLPVLTQAPRASSVPLLCCILAANAWADQIPTKEGVAEITAPTAYEAQRFGITMSPEVPMTTQQRAYTSPIW